MHSDDKTRKCHFFNNNKPCPYEEVGCKFLHETSEACYYKDKCNNPLCQFQHSDGKEQSEKESSSKKDFKCKTCEFITSEENILEEHKTNYHKYDKYDKLGRRDQFEVQELVCSQKKVVRHNFIHNC